MCIERIEPHQLGQITPSSSFKDRGMTMAISKAREAGSEAVICASTGNTSAAPMVLGHTVEPPDAIATAICIGNPVNKENALNVLRESNGDFMAVTDAEIIDAYKLLFKGEGVFCEPASAASVAGRIRRREEVPAGATVVCVLTGIAPDTETIARVMGF